MPKGKAAHQPVTPERRRKFLEVLAETGSPVEAARQAPGTSSQEKRGWGGKRRGSLLARMRDDSGRGPIPDPPPQKRGGDGRLAVCNAVRFLCVSAGLRAAAKQVEPI